MCPIAVELNMSYFVFCKIKGSYPIIYTYFIIVLTASHNNLSCTLTLTESKNTKILSLDFFLALNVILRKILRIFANTDPGFDP